MSVLNPARLKSWSEDQRLRSLSDKATDLRRSLAKLDVERPKATADLAEARDAFEEAEIRRLVGDIDPKVHAAAKDRLAQAEEAVARIAAETTIAMRDLERLDEAQSTVVDMAKTDERDALHREYAAAIAEMDKHLAAASEANERVFQLWDRGLVDFGAFSETSSTGTRWPSYGGLHKMHWHELDLADHQSHAQDHGTAVLSKYERWREDARENGWLPR